MFSKRLATERLQALSEYSTQTEAGLWIPEYHSLSQIESFNAHFKAIGEKAERNGGTAEDVLGQDELAWIDNEYKICEADTRYWLENYAFINDDGVLKRFAPRHSQSMLIDLWAEREDAGLSLPFEQLPCDWQLVQCDNGKVRREVG
jgi:hypothetical protein